MKAGHSYLTLAVAFILAIIVLQALHLLYKPAALEWGLYDPTFVYALQETPEALGRLSCQPNTVMAFGSSVLDTALARRGADWRRRDAWRRYSGSLDDTQSIVSIIRAGKTDLRMFYPMLSMLPNCKKIIVLHAGTLLRWNRANKGTWHRLRTLLFDSPVYYYGTLVERFWAPSYRIRFTKGVRAINRAKQPFEEARFKNAYRRREKLREILPEHRDMIQALIENKAEVVVLDIDRTAEWEAGGASEQRNYRRILQAFAATHKSIHYRHFSSIDAQYYRDFTHLNSKGAEIFRPWLASETAAIARDIHGF